MNEIRTNVHRGIPWMKTKPCETCGTPNEVCARPPGAVHEEQCATCGHTVACHVW